MNEITRKVVLVELVQVKISEVVVGLDPLPAQVGGKPIGRTQPPEPPESDSQQKCGSVQIPAQNLNLRLPCAHNEKLTAKNRG